MKQKKSRFKPGDTVYARSPRINKYSVLITLLYYRPNYEWHAEFIDPETNELRRDDFDEREFD